MNDQCLSIGAARGVFCLLFAAFGVTTPVLADPLPADHKIDWTFAGVPGGIPYRTTIYQSFSPGATAAQINSALSSCPSNQVVLLSAGSYSLNSALTISRNGVTLRGSTNSSGAPATILNFSGATGDGLINIPGSYPANNWGSMPYRDVTSGYAQGSTSMTLASAPTGLQVGYIMVLDQVDDENKVRASTSVEGAGIWGGRNGNRAYSQFLRVKSINGSTVTFEPPIYGPYWAASQSPQVYWWGASTTRSGIEDVQVIRPVGGGGIQNIHIALADSCWVRNANVQQAYNGLIRTAWTLNCEIRDCYLTLHDDVGSATYSLYITYSGSLLAENNIGYNTPCFWGMMDTMGCVMAYNYATNFPYSQANWLPECMMVHGGHNYFDLFEGNMAPSFWSDFTHGNASYNTIHRNRCTGWEPGKTGSLHPGNLQQYQDYYAFIGNVFGTPGIQSSYTDIWQVDSTSAATIIRKGNFNTADNAIPSSESLGSDTLVSSYYRSAKPAWFWNLPWPPFSPTTPGAASATNLPAGYRFIKGAPPASGPPNLPPIAVLNVNPNTNRIPTNSPLSFSAAGSYDPEGVSVSYNWNFGDGSTSTQQAVNHSFATSGTYNVQLSVTDGVNTTTTNRTITVVLVGVNLPPTAAASANPLGGVAPLTVAFSSAGSSDPEGTSLTYSWTFGDGTTSTQANPTKIYSNAGVYGAQLTVSDGTNTSSKSVVITVANGASGLVAAYGFEEGSGGTVADASGNNNTGTITSAAWTSSGKFGKALSFNGSSAMVTVNDANSLDLTSGMTLEAWVQPSATASTWKDVIFKATDIYYLMGFTPQGTPDMGGTFASANVYGASALPVNTWTHLAATYDGAIMSFYVNGVLASSRAQTGAIAASTGALSIGGDSISSGQFWAGLIDEVRIYNRALSGIEIQDDMNTPVAGSVTRPTAPTGLHVVSAP
jgi:PKD repeat protein